MPIDDNYGFHPEMAPIKQFWDEGKMALIHGIGYDNSPRSHFRSMDIWHTCEPDKVGTEGWVGRSIKAVDPEKENVLTGVNFGQGLPRAMALPGVPVASVSDIENYGVLTGITDEDQRMRALDRFQRIYSPAIGRGPVMDYLGQTGLDALKGADILKTAPEMYSSDVEYAATPIAQKLQRHLDGAPGEPGDALLLHPARQLRHPRQPDGRPRATVEGLRRRHFGTSSPTCGPTTPLRTWCLSCSASSVVASATTAPAPTTAPAESPSPSATPSRAATTPSTRP